jgi:non-homologous end joining protein Ku
LGRALSPGAARQDRHASLRRDLRGDKILLTTLRTHEEVREAEEIGHPDLPLPDPPMLEIAEKIIDQQRANSIRRSSSIATRRRCAC